MDRLSLIAMVFFASLVSPRPVAACTCEPFATPLEGLEFADVVFHGEVREARASEDRRRTLWEFDVVAVWKGILTESVVVASPDRDAEVDCFFRFDRGGEYIVYALRDADGFLIADLCSRTALFDPQEAEGLGAPIAEFGHAAQGGDALQSQYADWCLIPRARTRS